MQAEPLLGIVLQPQQHAAKGQLPQIDPPAASMRVAEDFPVQPRPDVAEDQGRPHVQQAQQRVARTRPNPGLLHLSVAGFDPEPLAVSVLDPLVRARLQPAAVGVHQRLAPVPTALAAPVAALDADRNGGALLGATGQGVTPPAALLPAGEHPAGAGPFGVVGLAATQDQRRQKRVAGPLQVADNRDRAETPVQQQVTRPDAGPGRLPEQLPDDLREGLPLGDADQRHTEALALAGDVGGGIGVEVAGATAGLAAVDLGGVVQRLAVVGHQLQVDGQRLPALTQDPGQVALQRPVEATLQFGDVRQGGQQGIAGGCVRWRIAQGPASGGQRTEACGGPEQESPQDAGLALAAVGLQADVPLADVLGVNVDGAAGDGILPGSHGPLLV